MSKVPVRSLPSEYQQSVFHRPDALPAALPTVPKHWKEINILLRYYTLKQVMLLPLRHVLPRLQNQKICWRAFLVSSSFPLVLASVCFAHILQPVNYTWMQLAVSGKSNNTSSKMQDTPTPLPAWNEPFSYTSILNAVLHRLWLLHGTLAAAQCIAIGPVSLCVCVCGSVTTITWNCMHQSSPNCICK